MLEVVFVQIHDFQDLFSIPETREEEMYAFWYFCNYVRAGDVPMALDMYVYRGRKQE